MAWTQLSFGKYSGKTLPQILFKDPDYFFWAYSQNLFKDKGILLTEAEDIHRKATSIKIPEKWGEDTEVEYVIHPGVKKFTRADVVQNTQPLHQGSSQTFRTKCFDLSVPSKIASYDKTGGSLLIKAIKFYVFDNTEIKITKKLIEEFFDNSENFDLV